MHKYNKIFTDQGIAELRDRLGLSTNNIEISTDDDGLDVELTGGVRETEYAKQIEFPWPILITSQNIKQAADGTITLDIILTANDIDGVTNYEYRIVSV